MFLTAREMYALEESVFASGVPAEALMNEAGRKVALEILRRFPSPPSGHALAYVGKGNNGADAMVALRHLRDAGWQVALRLVGSPSSFRDLPAKKYAELGDVPILPTAQNEGSPGPFVILDGLLGIGTTGNLREPLASLAREINELAAKSHAYVVAIDVPSGLDCDTGASGPETVRANLTCTLGSPKAGLVADQATALVGSLALLSVQGLSDWDLQRDHLITPGTLPVEKLKRPYDFHKGQAGRIGLIAGSRGLAGAAALSSLGALHGGGGLITLFVRERDYPLILPLIPVEVMVQPVESYREVLSAKLDALALGPGLGKADEDVLSVIKEFPGPVVVDADALNLIARRSSIHQLATNHLVTPHPGEMARLFDFDQGRHSRAAVAREFVRRSRATLLFKGARTIVTAPEAPLAYNTTGTPGMATGGQGDVLTGLLVALLARGFPLLEAAKLGAWLAGRASEIALQEESEESLSATATARHLGAAFNDLRRNKE